MHHHTKGFAHPHDNARELGLEHGMRVADFGAGSGHYTMALGEAVGKEGIVYAVDVQKDLLMRIKNDAHRRHMPQVEIVWGDLELRHGSKIADRALDLALASNILFQLADKRAFFDEVWRVLKPSGRLALIDWKDSYHHTGPHPDHVITKETALALAEKSGFRILREFDAGAHHWGLLLRLAPRDAVL